MILFQDNRLSSKSVFPVCKTTLYLLSLWQSLPVEIWQKNSSVTHSTSLGTIDDTAKGGLTISWELFKGGGGGGGGGSVRTEPSRQLLDDCTHKKKKQQKESGNLYITIF